MQNRFLPLAALSFLALAACDTMDETWSDMWGDDRPIASSGTGMASGCPQVAVVRDLSIYQNPPAANESNLILTARMGHIKGGCSADGGNVTVNSTVDFVALRGDKSASTRASLPFFVSVLDTQDNVVSKKVYEVPVDFENNAKDVRITSPIEASFAVKSGEDATGYRVLLGFHLSAEQVDANTRFFSQMPGVQ
jgi:hypothetical protein